MRNKQINYNIAADIKPWFFIYRYSYLKTELDKYEKTVKSNCKIRFGKTLDELYQSNTRTQDEDDFLCYYEKYMPVSRAPGTMNRICWKIEDEFKTTNVLPNVQFDYSILKSSDEYTVDEYDKINLLYNEYNKNMQIFLRGVKKNESLKEERDMFVSQLTDDFSARCAMVCPNENVLANILVDICYSSNKNKAFAWNVAGELIFNNILNNSGGVMHYPIKDSHGSIEFCGERFSLHTQQIGGDLIVNS